MTYKMSSLKGEWIYVSYCPSDHVLTSIASVDIINIQRLHQRNDLKLHTMMALYIVNCYALLHVCTYCLGDRRHRI